MDGVIYGVNVGGNCSGIPTPAGFVYFDDCYRGKPLIFVGTIGLIPRRLSDTKLSYEKKAMPGDNIVIVGGRVGKDGIHGATFSSEAMDEGSPATAVQIGDPITQKKLSDAIIKEARDKELYNSMTDNGAGGLSCSVAEMARECGGFIVDLEKVPLKYPGLQPWEIWISESQERMTLAVADDKIEELTTALLGDPVKIKPMKDPERPKRPTSGYLYFCQAARPAIMKEMSKNNAKLVLGNIAKVLGKDWKALSDKKRKVYENKSKIDKERYEEEMEQYNANH